MCGLLKSTQCAGTAKGPTFASVLVFDGRYPDTGVNESARCALGRRQARRSRRLLLSTGAIYVLSAGVSESALCELVRPTTRRSRRLLLSAGVIFVLMLRVSWVELVWVGSGWFGLSCWVVESRVDAMCGCLRSASASAWGCGAVCGAYCASPWVVCCVQDDCLVLSCRVRLSRV